MEEQILYIAIEKLNELKGFKCAVIKEEIKIHDRFINAEIEIGYGSFREKRFVEIKKKVLPEQVPVILERFTESGLLIIAEYITPKAKELLRLNNIPYIDTAGNMFFKSNSVYIDIQTGKTNRSSLKTNTKAFNRAGLKVIYQFLINPEYVNESYRFIGEKAGVTIATVGVVLKDLLRERYLIQSDRRKYRFNDRAKLFEEWVKEYNRKLKPKLKSKRYRWLDKNENWRSIKLPEGAYWGGVNAAELLTEYLIAEKVEIYTELQFEEVMKSLKMLPDKSGDIIVTESFWKSKGTSLGLVDPVLVYADLLNEANPRYLETAKKVYKEYVQNKL